MRALRDWLKWNWESAVFMAIGLGIVFGVNWMAYEQRRANAGFFISFPQEVHRKSF